MEQYVWLFAGLFVGVGLIVEKRGLAMSVLIALPFGLMLAVSAAYQNGLLTGPGGKLIVASVTEVAALVVIGLILSGPVVWTLKRCGN